MSHLSLLDLTLTPSTQNILLVGSLPQLGNWNPANAIPLSASKYTSSNNLWFATVSLPSSTDFQYKVSCHHPRAWDGTDEEIQFIRKAANGSIKWQSDPNQFVLVSLSPELELMEICDRSARTNASGTQTLSSTFK